MTMDSVTITRSMANTLKFNEQGLLEIRTPCGLA